MARLFTRETEMAEPVAAWLREQGSSCVAHEVRASIGVADLVAGVGSRRRLLNRRRQAPPITVSIQLQLLEFCSSTRTEDELREWSPRRMSDLRRDAIDPLVDASLLEERGSGRWRSKRRPVDPFDVLIAVELKLSDVARGISQAFSYRAFAESSYLALPGPRVTAHAMGLARRHGVGLLAVLSTGVDEVIEPADDASTAWRRRIASERVLEAKADPTRLAGSFSR